MISVIEAEQKLRQAAPEIVTEQVALSKAQGRVLARPVIAPIDSPHFDNSAMDGFAVRWADVEAAKTGKPVSLKLLGESRAGVPAGVHLEPGCAIRINTGGMMPPGADTVIPVEETTEEGQWVKISQVKKKGQHIRKRGEEFKSGATLLKEGDVLEAPQIALLAHVGISEIEVIARPKVSLVITGTELVAVGAKKAPYQIHDSNSHMLRALVNRAGGEVVDTDCVADDLQTTISAIHNSEAVSDLIIFSGGVSMGPHDHVKNAAAAAGYQTLFWKVNQKPGKPLFAATKENKLLIGLPGNPVSAFMSFIYYLYPLLKKIGGQPYSWKPIPATLEDSFINKGERIQFVRIRLVKKDSSEQFVKRVVHQGSHMITSISQSDGFLILQPNEQRQPGDKKEVYLYPWRTKDGLY